MNNRGEKNLSSMLKSSIVINNNVLTKSPSAMKTTIENIIRNRIAYMSKTSDISGCQLNSQQPKQNNAGENDQTNNYRH